MKVYRFLPVFIFVVMSCIQESPPDFPEGPVAGYMPVYGDSAQAFNIVAVESRDLKRPGKIYTYNHLLLVNEVYEGVHVINNADPADPKPLFFIEIPGNVDLAMKGNIIYADNYNDLLLIKISANGVEDVKRIKDAIHQKPYGVPPASGYFECVDETKGYVVGWQQVTLQSPKCFH